MKTQNHQNLCEIVLPAMGGQFIYRAYPQPYRSFSEVEELFHLAHKEVLRIEKTYTEFHPSELTRVNDFAGKGAYQVSEEFFELLMQSNDYYKKSQGVFDPTYASYLTRWRESVSEGVPLSKLEKIKLKSLVNFSKVKLDSRKQTISIPHPDMKIGLGGIGKGYAVDRAYLKLREEGLVNFSVNGSGDMRVHSHEDAPRPWKIGIRNPFTKNPNQSAGLIQLAQGSVSTSGSYIQKRKGDETGKDHHIVHRYKDSKAPPPVSTTIVGESCMDTDVWGTISMAVEIPVGLQLLNQNDICGVLIDQSGKTHLTNKAMGFFG